MSNALFNILLVNASGRKHNSVSRQLSQELLDALKSAGVNAVVTKRDLADGVPFVDEDWINANFTPEEERTADQAATLSFSDGLVDELKAADIIIISAPIYNFAIPAGLKAWIDQIARARLTFKYTESGPVGLLKDKRAVIVTASGGTEAGSAIDFASDYLRHILGFIGVADVSQVAADKLMVDADAAMAKARGQIAAVAAALVEAHAEAA